MGSFLAISSQLSHDGDGLVRYRLVVESSGFQGHTEAWGHESDVRELAVALRGFPVAAGAKVMYSFGSPGTGTASLRFEVVDPLGHCHAWISIVATHPVARTGEHESAHVCIGFNPADMDRFCRQLEDFTPGRFNEAELSGHVA